MTAKVLIIGANGQLGRDLVRRLDNRFQLIAATRHAPHHFDLARPEILGGKIRTLEPHLVINAAAYTAVDKAESEPDLAETVNGRAPGAMAGACADLGIPLIHYSTDYVFDGSKSSPYREDDTTSPLGEYGRTKLLGEQNIAASGCEYTILRTSWVYAAHGHNFLRTMLRLAGERDELTIVDDQIGSPTWTGYLADVTAQLANMRLNEKKSISGLYHLTCEGKTSWHGFAKAIFERACELGIIENIPAVSPIKTRDYPTPAKRPLYSVLDNGKIQSCLSVASLSWQEGLEKCLVEITDSR